ncbi:MAG: hypothetical protein ACOH17_07250 [Cellulomonas sp.]
MQRSLQAQVRDPLWFLARQWQLGEFAGEDAGSPVQATMSVQSRPLTGYAPDGTGVAAAAFDRGLALEAHVERVPVVLNVRGSAQLGRRVENALRASLPASSADAAIVALRAAYPIAPTAPPDAAEDSLGRAMRATLAGRVVDGLALATAYAVAQAGGAPSPALPPAATEPAVAAVLTELVAYRASLYSEPSGDDAWRSRRLDYAATVTSTAVAVDASGPDTVALVAPDFRGGDLDWFSFSLASAPSDAPSAPAAPNETVQTFNFLPGHVTFRGMPAPRWWEFEDGVTDFGAITPDKVDLATLLVMEFALVFGNDWFEVPVPTTVGSLSRITTLVVTDTFGVRTVVEPTESLSVGGDQAPWSMFTISGSGGRSPYLLMPPCLGVVMEGAPLEDVVLLRDDMAAMAWAVEHRLHGPMDVAIDALQLAFEHDAAYPTPPLPTQVPGGPAQTYVLQTEVPDNWIPLVPVVAPSGARYLRRGVLVRPGRGDVHADAALLEPGHPLFVADESVPREGAEVTRYFRRIRWSDGSTTTWLAHQNRPGRGPGWSGLGFDLVTPLPPGKAP